MTPGQAGQFALRTEWAAVRVGLASDRRVPHTRSGELLASEVYPQPQLNEVVPRYLLGGSLVGYRYKEGEDGLPFVEIVTLELVQS